MIFFSNQYSANFVLTMQLLCFTEKNGDWSIASSCFRGSKLGFGKSMNLVRICDLTSLRSARRRVSVIRNSNQGSDLAELQPASEGSPLLCIRDSFKKFIF
ncbi:hypothetical protein ARALYDRAFT_902101 [Arabidopsis lyrata subsp. lyrata]|uniref:Uncharacterized protein n=1 Tax=Arabidopsis lyrata subsp. lyrata TaxID=81972 RepID=D7LCB1_ARALL|nr:hypothetical protein ARALYDRAFT_902101 [Arabidopsis lyrata subsp. lyrata]